MNSKVVYGVYNTIGNRSIEYQNHIRGITYFSLFYQKYLHRDIIYPNILEEKIVDKIITKAYETGCEWLYLIAYGERFYNHNIIELVLQQAAKNKCSIIGHILQTTYPDGTLGEDEYFLHHQNLLLNLHTWDRIGRPFFGEEGVHEVDHHIALRSEENFHDNYTPYWLKPTGEKRKYTGYLGSGWNLINCALDYNEPIEAFTEEIKNGKMFLYPEDGNVGLEGILSGTTEEIDNTTKHIITNYNQQIYLEQTELKNYRNQIYLFNTDKVLKDNIEYKLPINNIYCASSGFKAFLLLFQSNWNDSSRIIFYDYSQVSLELKKWLITNWDGEDYLKAIRDFNNYYNQDILYLWHSAININTDIKLIEKGIEDIYKFFGGKDNWLIFWKKIKKLTYSFINCNILGDYDNLIEDMYSNKGNNIVWLSNIFYSEPIIRNFSPSTLNSKYSLLEDKIKANSETVQIIGAKPIFYEKPSEYS